LQVFDTADVYGPFTKYAYVCVGGIHEQLMQCDVAVRFVGRGLSVVGWKCADTWMHGTQLFLC